MPSALSPDLEDRLAQEAEAVGVPAWVLWLACILPGYCTAPFGPHHRQFWEWLWGIEPEDRPEAFVGIWARGGAKSTSAEAACVALAGRKARRYGLYVCDTQDRADDHVGNVASMLESERVELFYPALSERRVGKHGNSKGWRRNRLWTADGFVLDAIGLDVAARGVKLEDQRPDFLVIDDIDARHDTAAATAKKVETLTEGVLPAGAENLAVLAIQNLIIPDGVFAQLADGRADFLRRRIVSGPIPALTDMRVEHVDGFDVIIEGTPTWAGQSLERCRELAADWGMTSFRREAQHEVADAKGALWAREQIAAARVEDHPDLELLVVSVDPSGGRGKGHDDQGIIAVGRRAGHGYVIEDATCSLSPMGWGKQAVRLAVDLSADRIIVEDNYGGEAMTSNVRLAADQLVREGIADAARFGSQSSLVRPVNAGGLSKAERAHPVAALYGEKERPETWASSRVHHVGRFDALEAEQTGWEPGITPKSPNRLDALVHGLTDLGIVPGNRGRRRSIVEVGTS